MRVDAINSWLSASPFVEAVPVQRVGKGVEEQLIPRERPVRIQLFVYDSVGRAEKRDIPTIASSKISLHERLELERFIERQRRRTDHLHAFPALLNARFG